MRFSLFCFPVLLSVFLTGCRAGVSAQSAAESTGRGTASPSPSSAPGGAARSSSSSATANTDLEVSISSIDGSTAYSRSQAKSPSPRILTFFSADAPHINVVLRNTSARPLSIYQEWNSWGYFNLSLEITKINGKSLPKPIIVQKEGRDWLKNFAETETIGPGECVVREVHLPPITGKKPNSTLRYGFYLHFPLKPTASDVYTMRAVFQEPGGFMPDSNRQRDGETVWKGKVASPSLEYIFR